MDLQAYNYMYGLSQLGIRGLRCLGLTSFSSGRDRDIIHMLNDFASLLVFNPGETAAVAVAPYPRLFKVYWAKNVESLPADIDYVATMIQRIATEPRFRDVMQILVPRCKAKIHQYARELARTFEPIKGRTNLWSLYKQDHAYEEIRNNLIEEQLMAPEFSPAHFLDGFTRTLAQSKTLPDGIICHVLHVAGVLGELPVILDFVPHERIRCLRQLGVYYRAWRELHWKLQVYRAKGFKIEVDHARNPVAWSPIVKCNTIEALTMGTKHSISFHSIFDYFPHALPGGYPRRGLSLRCAEHSPIIACLPLLQCSGLKPKFYLGVSELYCCQWCENWLKKASTTHTIHRSFPVNGPYTPGWLIPQGGPRAITSAMVKEMKEMVETLVSELASNTLPKRPAEEEMVSSEEEFDGYERVQSWIDSVE